MFYTYDEQILSDLHKLDNCRKDRDMYDVITASKVNFCDQVEPKLQALSEALMHYNDDMDDHYVRELSDAQIIEAATKKLVMLQKLLVTSKVLSEGLVMAIMAERPRDI